MTYRTHRFLVLICMTMLAACAKEEAAQEPALEANGPADVSTAVVDAVPAEITIDETAFRCLDEMKKIRHFFVDNLLGDLEATVAVAESTDGGTWPAGSVVQLVPGEVMVKHREGYNAATRDWEFFELDVSADGNTFRNRGFVDVVNKFGGNCFTCHIKAEPKYDLICERGHGCDDIPVTREMIADIQTADPRCAS